MSPRTPKRRRRSKAQPAAAGNGSPATLLSQVSELVNENQALVRENKELHSIIARIKPGDVLDLYTEDCFAGKIRSEQELFSKVCEYPYVNPQTGPFYIEGAEPGDTLAIHLIDVQPARDWAASVTVLLFGALTGTHYTQTLQDPLPEKTWIYKVDQASKSVLFKALDSDYGTSFPLEPFHGTIGVAPAAFEARNVLVPEAFGGNMDTPEAKAGATIYLGVNVPGALFSLGDGHYTMGEGETCGVAVEGAMNTVLTVDVEIGRRSVGEEVRW